MRILSLQSDINLKKCLLRKSETKSRHDGAVFGRQRQVGV